MTYAIQIVWEDGDVEYVKEGTPGTPIAEFETREEAQKIRDSIALEGHQSISVVEGSVKRD